MELVIQDHEVMCIIGVWDHERLTPQRVRLNLKLNFDASAASLSDRLDDTINYAQLAETATFILQQGKFQLLETAVRLLVRHFLLPLSEDYTGPSATSAEVSLTKYDALPGDTLATIRMRANRDDVQYEREQPDWGRVEVIGESADLGLYCLHIAPQMTLPLHHHERMGESEFILDRGLSLLELNKEPRVLDAGAVFNWPREHVHGYLNTTQQWCRVLCIDSPPFIPEDEVLWKQA